MTFRAMLQKQTLVPTVLSSTAITAYTALSTLVIPLVEMFCSKLTGPLVSATPMTTTEEIITATWGPKKA